MWADLGFGGDREHVGRRLRITGVASRSRQAPLRKEVTMSQPYRSSGQPAEPRRPAAPAPVRTAVTLMYAGAAVSTVTVIVALALIPPSRPASARRTRA